MAGKTLFISRAGADAAFAEEIGTVLEAAGYEVILQQWDFANRNFMERMHAALAGGAHVVALLSPEYLRSDHCQAEWMNALAGDPLNRNGRLIVLRVAECEPPGLLAGLAYWDLVPLFGDRPLLEEVVTRAVSGERVAPSGGGFWRGPRTILDAEAIRPTASFSGRDVEVEQLAQALATPGAIVAVHGSGGMGKSSLARQYAWLHRDEYSVVWWLDAETETGIIDRLVALGTLFVRDLDRVADRRAAAKQVIASLLGGFAKPVLLIFDNLEDEQLLDEWRPRSGTKIILTTRLSHWGGDVGSIPLRRWDAATAIAYLRRECGRGDLSEEGAASLAAALDGLPLALGHAAAYLRSTQTVTAERYIARINDQLKRAPRGSSYPRSVYATFHEQLRRAESEATGSAAVACLAAYFAPDAIPEELFTLPSATYAEDLVPTVNGVDSPLGLRATLSDGLAFEEALGALDRLWLIEFSPASRSFGMHRLVQAAARDLLSDQVRWLESAVDALDAAFPADVEFVSWGVCERLLPHVLAASELISEFGLRVSSAAALTGRSAIYLEDRCRFEEAERLARQSTALQEALVGLEHPDYARSLNELGNVLHDQGRYAEAEALHARALEIRRSALPTRHLDIAASLNNLGNVYWYQARYLEAVALHLEAAELRERIEGTDTMLFTTSLSNLATAYWSLGRYAEAEEVQARALAIRERILPPGHPEIARSVSNLGEIYEALGRFEEAGRLHERALDLRQNSVGMDHTDTAASLDNLAGIRTRQGRYLEAEELARRALEISERMRGPGHGDVAFCLDRLGTIFELQERYDEAEPLLERALAIREEGSGSGHPIVADSLEHLAKLYAATGRETEAASLRERAASIRSPETATSRG